MSKKNVLVVLILVLFCKFSYAETIQLKSGIVLDEKILEKTKEYIKVNVSGIPLTYYLEDIESINGVRVEEESFKILSFSEARIECSKKQNQYLRPSSVLQDITPLNLRNFAIDLQKYYYNISESGPPEDHEILKKIKEIAVDNQIHEAKQWELTSWDGFFDQVTKYLRKHGLIFIVSLDTYQNTVDFFLAGLKKTEAVEITLSSPWNETVGFLNLLIGSSYYKTAIVSESFRIKLMTGKKTSEDGVVYNIDAYYKQAVYLFFWFFHFMELRGINIEESESLSNENLAVIAAGTDDDLSSGTILSRKLTYVSWRKEYLRAINAHHEEDKQVVHFAELFANESIRLVNLYSAICIMQEVSGQRDTDMDIQNEYEAIMGELIMSPNFIKSLEYNLRLLDNESDGIRRKPIEKALIRIADTYFEYLREANKPVPLVYQEEDVMLRLRGIEMLSEEELKTISSKIAHSVFGR